MSIYWYDGTSSGPTSQQLTLANHADVKVRLGFVNAHGQQKGVDSLIVTDMIALARNGAMSGAVVLSGDEDVRVCRIRWKVGTRARAGVAQPIPSPVPNGDFFVRVAPATILIRQSEAMGRPSRLTVTIPAAGGIIVSGHAVRPDFE